jgi:hypothetical protein
LIVKGFVLAIIVSSAHDYGAHPLFLDARSGLVGDRQRNGPYDEYGRYSCHDKYRKSDGPYPSKTPSLRPGYGLGGTNHFRTCDGRCLSYGLLTDVLYLNTHFGPLGQFGTKPFRCEFHPDETTIDPHNFAITLRAVFEQHES